MTLAGSRRGSHLPRPLLLVAAVGLVLAAAVPLRAAPAAAAGPESQAKTGYDISWPQCGGPFPLLTAGQYGIVGVTGGRPFTANPCFADEYRWASLGGQVPSVYVNVAFGTSEDGPCAVSDPPCRAYDYGWATARAAFMQAWISTDGASLDAATWWLDVEEGNVWSGDQMADGLVVRGAVDFLRQAHRTVGVYSTPFMWSEIAGGTYYSPPAGVLNWVAGAAGDGDIGMCGQPLWPGGQVSLYQYLLPGQQFDQDHSC